MAGTVTFVVDLDAAGAPPAVDSVRQLLALLDGLQDQDAKLDWRLVSISTNSPLRAQVEAFDRQGAPVSNNEAAQAASAAFRVLDATNDNEREAVVQGLSDENRKRLRAFITPIKERGGLVRIQVGDQPERVITGDRAQKTYNAISAVAKRRRPELGSIEGQILAATTHYGSPALRVRTFLTKDEVVCVFSKEAIGLIGAEHTLAEVWNGRRVVVGGKISYDASGRPATVQAQSLRTIGGVQRSFAESEWKGEATAEDWGEAH
ncbi:hypothetical protein [Caulobacter sp. DWR3-1-2]|uniref:hypothetical protein n=1 Tax=Caulobacter sp. DWR3-1-2 TaxID=2804647 RepID=UPI00199DAEBA|nr:hypothetical protein [Caulobacter sp.]